MSNIIVVLKKLTIEIPLLKELHKIPEGDSEIMIKILQWISTLLSLLFGALWLWRYLFAYNAQGAYLNETEGVVYHEQAVLVYGALTILCLLFTVLFWILAHKRKT